MTTPAGATKTDWDRFLELGLTEDLLPVVSDVSIPISPRSRIEDAGKTPSVVNGEGHIVGLVKWTARSTTAAEVKNWAKDARLGICLQTRQVRAFDVDIPDPAISARVRDIIEMGAGVLPCRWRANSGKLLLAFRMPGDFRKERIETEHGPIEFLATGQQFIAGGTHLSGVRYAWEGLDAGIPELTPEEFTLIWQALAETFGQGVVPRTARAATSHSDPVVGFTEDDIRQMLAVLDPTMKYDPWISVGQAIHHESRGAWMHLWDEWSADGEYPGASAIEYKWSTFGHGSGPVVTARSLAHMAEQAAKEKGVALTVRQAKPEEFPLVEVPAGETAPAELPAFERDKQGKILPTVTNAVAALLRHDFCDAQIAYDEFKDATMVAWAAEHAWRPLRDTDYTRLRGVLERRGFKNPGRELVRDAVMQIAEDNRFDSAIQWAESLVWDGVPRVVGFLTKYMSAPAGGYAQSVSCYMWTALAARCLVPGAKCDMVPVLVGGQGTGKSTGVMAMSPEPDSYVEVNLEHRDDNLARSLRGKLVGELGELRGLATKDAEAIKAWITRTHEEWIPKYVEFATKFPRRLVFIGTTNSDEFLADDTGERRWLPVDVGAVDVEGIERDRAQLWAEAVVLFKRDGVQWRDALSLAADKHDNYKVSDPWQSAIEGWLNADEMDSTDGAPRCDSPFKLEHVLHGALALDARNLGMREQKRAASVLRRLGFVKRRATRAEGGKHIWERAIDCTFGDLA